MDILYRWLFKPEIELTFIDNCIAVIECITIFIILYIIFILWANKK